MEETDNLRKRKRPDGKPGLKETRDTERRQKTIDRRDLYREKAEAGAAGTAVVAEVDEGVDE